MEVGVRFMSKNGCDYYTPIKADIMNCCNCTEWLGSKCRKHDELKKQVEYACKAKAD